MTLALRPDGTLALTADDIDRAAQAHVEGRFFPREKHERTVFTNTQGRSGPAREAVSTHRPGAEPDRGPSKVGAKLAAHPLTPNRTNSKNAIVIRRPAPLTSAGEA